MNTKQAMKKSSTVFLQIVLVIIGIATAALMLWEPQNEGRNIGVSLFQIYFNDPFLAYAYVGSIFFFITLYQAFKLLGNIGRNEVFSPSSVKALKTIKQCAIILASFIFGAEIYFFTVVRGTDDVTGGVMMGLILIFISSVISTAAAVFEKTLQSAVDIKSENDLTV